jgi:hypothetical protein
VKLTRREFVGGAAGAALAGTGLYALVDRFAGAPARAASALPHLPEQHIIQDLRIVVTDGVQVFAPPLHSQVVTANLRVEETPQALADARVELEQRLLHLDNTFVSSPAGLAVTVAWGLPYFRRYVLGQARRELPGDLRAAAAQHRYVAAVEDARAFPSDPEDLILEGNDVAVLLRSDSLAHIHEAASLLFREHDGMFRLTSIRNGFAGGGFGGEVSLPKRMATAAGVPGAEHIPDTAELFLGFTSTQKQEPGRARITNFETLGITDVHQGGYFAHGTSMHLSHLYEDLEVWYGSSHRDRVDAAFRPTLDVAPGVLTVKQGPAQVESEAGVIADYHRHRRIGHSGSLQPVTRLQHDHQGLDGVLYERGTPIPHRADFNTLDNPFSWSADPAADRMRTTAAAGLHFVVFNPSSDDFSRGRLAMDGVLTDGTVLRFGSGGHGQGFNSVLRTTHRQNFLVPPRAHRSFPLSELPA